ncbi:MAG: hypothetical protein WHT06_06295 [Desulfobacterales bacterium]
MTATLSRIGIPLGVLLGLLFAAAPAPAGLEVADAVAVAGRPVTLAVRTSALFAAEGGKRVTLTIAGEAPVEILTGGDGFGYFRFQPEAPGRMEVAARAGKEEASGRLLVLAPGEPLVVIEMESVLKTVLRPEESEACRSALQRIEQGFGLAFVTRLFGREIARRRIEQDGLTRAVALAWRGKATLQRLSELGIPIAAVIGSGEVTAAARGTGAKRIGFEKERGVERVSDWSQIPPLLEGGHPAGGAAAGR